MHVILHIMSRNVSGLLHTNIIAPFDTSTLSLLVINQESAKNVDLLYNTRKLYCFVAWEAIRWKVLHMVYRTAGIFRGGKIFVFFVLERRTTKFLPTKQYRIVWRSHMYCTATTKIFPQTGQKFTAHENFTPWTIPAIRYQAAYIPYVCWHCTILCNIPCSIINVPFILVVAQSVTHGFWGVQGICYPLVVNSTPPEAIKKC